MARVTSTEVYEHIARHSGTSTARARRILEGFFDLVQDRVAKGDTVVLTGFGKFYRRFRKASTAFGRYDAPEHHRPKFSAGSKFRRKVK